MSECHLAISPSRHLATSPPHHLAFTPYTKAALRLVVVRNPGLTARELAALTNWPPAKMATRLNALVADGEVVPGIKRKCGCSGCMAWTWEGRDANRAPPGGGNANRESGKA